MAHRCNISSRPIASIMPMAKAESEMPASRLRKPRKFEKRIDRIA
jgi:hypothetical protein